MSETFRTAVYVLTEIGIVLIGMALFAASQVGALYILTTTF